MKHRQTDYIDDLTVSAFVDGQLDAAGCENVVAAMELDPDTRERVYLMRRAKDLIKVGFQHAETPCPAKPVRPSFFGVRCSLALAASLLMAVIGFGSGVLGYYVSKEFSGPSRLSSAAAATHAATSNHVILHISESDPRLFAAALHYVEKFLDKNNTPGSQIEVVANSGGLDLMRADKSPFKAEVVAIMKRHNNVHIIACANAIRNLRKQGIEPKIIGDVDTHETAIDHIINRLQAGWTYVKVDDILPQI
jgi:intracellular sulfur oxidation DsrE/DsrF family protein